MASWWFLKVRGWTSNKRELLHATAQRARYLRDKRHGAAVYSSVFVFLMQRTPHCTFCVLSRAVLSVCWQAGAQAREKLISPAGNKTRETSVYFDESSGRSGDLA
jgi:hypothetical protein